jgi:putative ABC transport system permease protein
MVSSTRPSGEPFTSHRPERLCTPIAGLAWAHSSLAVMFGGLPLTDVLILLVGLPLIAAAGGWLLAGREPGAIARQPLD